MPKKSGYDSPKGMYSHKSNPMKQPSRVPQAFGPGQNKDQMKANKLLQQAKAKHESLRGKAGM